MHLSDISLARSIRVDAGTVIERTGAVCFSSPQPGVDRIDPAAVGIQKTMSGSPLAQAFIANRGALLRYLRARGAGDEGEDLLQELWLKLHGHDGDGVTDALAYLYRMGHNLMLDRRRATIRRQGREDVSHRDVRGGGAGDTPEAERRLLAREQLRHIDQALAALGSRTDLIFRRYRVEGVAQRGIAAELGITLSAVEKHLQKAYRAVAAAQRALSHDADPEFYDTGAVHDDR